MGCINKIFARFFFGACMRPLHASVLVALAVTTLVLACAPRAEGFTPAGTGTATPPDAPVVRVRRGKPVTADGLKTARTDADLVLEANGFRVNFAKRLAGAVWRLDWKGHVVVPELEGNGGSLQTALAFDVPIGETNELENPTEAGSVKDNYGKTTSRWLASATSDKEVYTETHMAYWAVPGEVVSSSPKGSRARVGSPLSDTTMRKRVKIGWKHKNVINYDIEITWTKRHWFTQIQILAAYLDRAFDKPYLAKGGKAVPLRASNARDFVSISPPQTSYPLIMAKSSSMAVGLYAHTVPPNGRFKPTWQPWYAGVWDGGHRDFGKGLQEVELTNISAVWHAGDPEKPDGQIIDDRVRFGCCLVFGSVDEVARIIEDIGKSLDRKNRGLEA